MNLTQLRDLTERTFWTAAEAFLAVFVVTDLSTAETGLISAAAAALTVIKSFVATKTGDGTAAFRR